MLSLWKYFIPPVNLICCSFTYILSKLILPVYWYRQSGSEMCPTEILLGTPCSPALSQFKYKEACLQWICSALIKAAEFSFSECLRSVWVSRKVRAKSVGNSYSWLCERSGPWCHGIIVLPLFSLGSFSPLVVRSCDFCMYWGESPIKPWKPTKNVLFSFR